MIKYSMFCLPFVAFATACAGGSASSLQNNDPSPIQLPSQPAVTQSPNAPCVVTALSAAAQMTDLNPPAWTWKGCPNNGNTLFNVQLDDPNAKPQQVANANFVPAGPINVGNHTLYVSQQVSGTWTTPTPLALAVLAKAQVAPAGAEPAMNGTGPRYDYPRIGGVLVNPNNLELAGINGFNVEDTMQGGLGDCWVNGVLGGLAFADPNYLFQHIKRATNPNGEPLQDANGYALYEITLLYPSNPNSDANMLTWTYITDAQFPEVSAGNATAYEHWVADGNNLKIGMPLLEKGVAALQSQTNYLELVTGGYTGLVGYQALGAGGWASGIFPAFLGNAGQNMDRDGIGAQFARAVQGGKVATVADINDGGWKPLPTLASGATFVPGTAEGEYVYTSADGKNTFLLFNQHYYVFMGSPAPGQIKGRNPWGTTSGPDGEFTMPVGDVEGIFNVFTQAQVP